MCEISASGQLPHRHAYGVNFKILHTLISSYHIHKILRNLDI